MCIQRVTLHYKDDINSSRLYNKNKYMTVSRRAGGGADVIIAKEF